MLMLSQLVEIATVYLWAFLRIAAIWMAMPVFGSGVLSARLRLVLACACTALIGPLMPELSLPEVGSAAWWLALLQEIALGVLMAMSLVLVFELVRLAAEILGLSMGLGFAQMTDPLNGTSSPVLGQYFSILAILLFLAGGGHVQVVDWMALSLIEQPPGVLVLQAESVAAPLVWFSQVFVGAMQVALPGVIALLLVNLSFGVISRAAPALNLFAIGFPASLILGLIMVLLTLPTLQARFTEAVVVAFDRLPALWQ